MPNTAVGQLFNIVDQSQQQNLVLKQEQFRDELIKDSTLNKSEPTEVKDAKGKSVKFIFKMLQTEGKDGKTEIILQQYKCSGSGTFKQYHVSADVNQIEKKAFLKIIDLDSKGKKIASEDFDDILDNLEKELKMHKILLEADDPPIPNIPKLLFHNIPEKKPPASTLNKVRNAVRNLFPGRKKAEAVPPSEYYLVQENFDGAVSNWIVGEKNFQKIAKDTSKSLQAIHKQKICLFDIKPENILVNINNGKVEKVAFTDFGGAKKVLSSKEPVRLSNRTRRYAAPEVGLRWEGSTPADIHAFGATLAEIRYGRRFPLFQGKDGKVKNEDEVSEEYLKLAKKNEAELDPTDKMILSMLDPKIENRPSAEKVAKHFN